MINTLTISFSFFNSLFDKVSILDDVISLSMKVNKKKSNQKERKEEEEEG